MEEIWKSTHLDNYQVSNLGRVRNKKTNRIIAISIVKDGYSSVRLACNKKQKTFVVHRLVANTFIDKIKGKNIVNHIDGNKTNNNVRNLEWCTNRENTQHAIRLGLISTSKGITQEESDDIVNLFKSGERIKEIEKKYNLSRSSIYYIIDRDGAKRKRNSNFRHSKSERIYLKKKIEESSKNNRELSKELNISAELIGRIKNNISWTDI